MKTNKYKAVGCGIDPLPIKKIEFEPVTFDGIQRIKITVYEQYNSNIWDVLWDHLIKKKQTTFSLSYFLQNEGVGKTYAIPSVTIKSIKRGTLDNDIDNLCTIEFECESNKTT